MNHCLTKTDVGFEEGNCEDMTISCLFFVCAFYSIQVNRFYFE